MRTPDAARRILRLAPYSIAVVLLGLSTTASAVPRTIKGQQTKSLLSSGGRMALFGASNDPGFPLYEFGPPGDPDRDPPDDPGQEPSSISSSAIVPMAGTGES